MDRNQKKLHSDEPRGDGAPSSAESSQTPAESVDPTAEMTFPSVEELDGYRERAAREGGPFLGSLLKVLPESSEADAMRDMVSMKKLQLELGFVAWDWRPDFKQYALDLLPENAAELRGWQKQVYELISQLPDEKEYGDFWSS